MLYILYILIMSSLDDTLFGPLPKQYCHLFYYMSIACFVFLILLIIATIGLSLSKRQSGVFYLYSVYIAIIYGIGYLQSRLLYTMCMNSL